MLEPLAEVDHASHQHELGADERLGDSDAEWRVGNVLRMENCGLEIDDGGEANVEIDRNGQKFPQFIDCPLLEICLRGTPAFHPNLQHYPVVANRPLDLLDAGLVDD